MHKMLPSRLRTTCFLLFLLVSVVATISSVEGANVNEKEVAEEKPRAATALADQPPTLKEDKTEMGEHNAIIDEKADQSAAMDEGKLAGKSKKRRRVKPNGAGGPSLMRRFVAPAVVALGLAHNPTMAFAGGVNGGALVNHNIHGSYHPQAVPFRDLESYRAAQQHTHNFNMPLGRRNRKLGAKDPKQPKQQVEFRDFDAWRNRRSDALKSFNNMPQQGSKDRNLVEEKGSVQKSPSITTQSKNTVNKRKHDSMSQDQDQQTNGGPTK